MRRKILKTIALLLAMVLPLALHAVNTITYTATYDMSMSSLGTDTLGGVTYTTVTYDGLFNGGEPGAPSLPVDYIRFSVPYNATNFTVIATLSNNAFESIPHLVYPCQEPRMMEDTVPWSITLPDNSIYNSGTFYPANNAWVVDEGFLAGENHIVTVAVMPISFRARRNGAIVTRQLKKTSTISLTLNYVLSDSLPIYPIVRRDSTLRQEGYRLTQTLVVNPDSVNVNAPIDMRMDSIIFKDMIHDEGLLVRDLPNDSSGVSPNDPHDPNPGVLYYEEYPYLIITTSELEHSMRRLKAQKEQLGYRVNVVTLDQIYNHRIASQGDIEYNQGNAIITDTSSVGKIRRYLKLAFATQNTKYVLLAGNNVPFKSVQINPNEENVATDWYYYDLNTNSATVKNDKYPDLIVGRLLAKTPEQINNYTDKVLKYENNPGNGDYSYLNRAIVTEGKKLDSTGEYYATVTGALTDIFPHVNYIKESEDHQWPKGRDVIDSINANYYAFICSLNHGSKTSIRVYGEDSEGKNYYIWARDSSKPNTDTECGNSLDSIHNKDYPMVYYSLCCSTIPYGYNGISFGESFTTGKNYGGPVYIGNTTSVFEPGSNESFNIFVSELEKADYKAGIAYSLSKKGFDGNFLSRNPRNALAHNYIGDPSIDIWTDEPLQYSEISVQRGDSIISISGINVDSTVVAIHGDGISKKRIFRTAMGQNMIFSGVSPNSTVMLYKHNYIPFIAPLLLQNATLNKSQYIIASDVIAGKFVETGRPQGDVSVSNGVEYEIEASGIVRLEDGFRVEKGATFAVYPASF